MDKELQVEVIRSSIEAKIRGEKHLIFIEVDTILGFSFRNRQSLQILALMDENGISDEATAIEV